MKLIKYLSVVFLLCFLVLIHLESNAQESEVTIHFVEGTPITDVIYEGEVINLFIHLRVSDQNQVAKLIVAEGSQEGLEDISRTEIPVVVQGNELYLKNGPLIYNNLIKYASHIELLKAEGAMFLTIYVEDKSGFSSSKLFYQAK